MQSGPTKKSKLLYPRTYRKKFGAFIRLVPIILLSHPTSFCMYSLKYMYNCTITKHHEHTDKKADVNQWHLQCKCLGRSTAALYKFVQYGLASTRKTCFADIH